MYTEHVLHHQPEVPAFRSCFLTHILAVVRTPDVTALGMLFQQFDSLWCHRYQDCSHSVRSRGCVHLFELLRKRQCNIHSEKEELTVSRQCEKSVCPIPKSTEKKTTDD